MQRVNARGWVGDARGTQEAMAGRARRAVVHGHVDANGRAQQRLDALPVAILRRNVERRGALVRPCVVDGGAGGEQDARTAGA